jgi:hypothetical protein
MLIPVEKISLILFTGYNIFETLTLMTLVSFTRHYIGKSDGLGVLRMPIFIASGIDAAMLLLNPFLKFLFSVEAITDDFGINYIVPMIIVLSIHIIRCWLYLWLVLF